ncbi:MAG TPA: SMC-Scp complex subunit ScpB [Steroidobacteraceae bacterium]|nr:SMC-Scp complex subunit ScpB [Steroidobacteraceae bacterium]
MNEQYVKNVIEAALLAAGRPLGVDELLALFDERSRPEKADVTGALTTLMEEYRDRGIELRKVASGYRVQIRPAMGAEVSRLWQERPQRYSRALLETLALIAYRQPITRGEIEDVRGVQVNPNIIRTLLDRSWIRVVGHRDVPGHPELLATTREFLDYFGLAALDELPSLAALRDMDNVGLQLELPAADAATVDGGDAGLAAAAEAEIEGQLGGADDESGDDEDAPGGDAQAAAPGLVASAERADDT